MRTGGGPPLPSLTTSGENILEVIGTTAIKGLNIKEPLVPIIEIDNYSLLSTSHCKGTGIDVELCDSDGSGSGNIITVASNDIENDHNYIRNTVEGKLSAKKPLTVLDAFYIQEYYK